MQQSNSKRIKNTVSSAKQTWMWVWVWDKYQEYLTVLYFSHHPSSSNKIMRTGNPSRSKQVRYSWCLRTWTFWHVEYKAVAEERIVGGKGDGGGGFLPKLQHSTHGWSQNSGELSGEAADQAINAESTKCCAVIENCSLFLLPEVFVFMVHYLYCVQTCSCPLIRSADFEAMDHEQTKPLLYYLDPFYGARRLEKASNFTTIRCFLLRFPQLASSPALNRPSLSRVTKHHDNIKEPPGLTEVSCWLFL